MRAPEGATAFKEAREAACTGDTIAIFPVGGETAMWAPTAACTIEDGLQDGLAWWKAAALDTFSFPGAEESRSVGPELGGSTGKLGIPDGFIQRGEGRSSRSS